MAEQRVRNSGKKSSALRDAAALTTQLAAGLEKIGLAMKSRTWRREGRAGLGPLQRQVLTLLSPSPGNARLSPRWQTSWSSGFRPRQKLSPHSNGSSCFDGVAI